MSSFCNRLSVLIVVVNFFTHFAYAQNSTTPTPSASTFYLAETETQFSLNVANASDDVHFYFASPAYSWVAVGFGQEMENSLMLVMYANQRGDNVTISPRVGRKNGEPTFTDKIKLEMLPGTMLDGNESMMIARAVCRNCRTFFDIKDTKQSMMYAFGHGALFSNSPSASLKRHVRYGHLTMDMAAATGTAGVPAKASRMNGVKEIGAMARDHDRANLAHAIIGCLALFVIWPLNVLFAGFFKNIRIHVGISVVVMVFLVVAYALGISTSAQFNRSKDYKTPHQIFAFIALAPILLLGILPIPRISTLHTLIPRLHTPLVSTTFLILVLTGGLGLHLSSQPRPIILGYAAVSLMVCIFTTVLQSCIRRRGSAHARAKRNMVQEDEMVMLKEARSASQASVGRGAESREFGADGQRRVGGGTMPGPQYLLNMHPGVPIHKW